MALTQVSTNGVKDGSLLNADVNGSAGIAGTKISPNFGSQNILTTGNAGIGTASPSNTLHVIGTGNDKGIDLTSSGAHALRFKIDSNPSNANDTIFFQSARWNGTEVASIHMRAGADTTNKDDGRLTFHTATSGSSTAERMRIDSSGRLLLGTTTEGHSSGDDLTIATSDTTGITLRSGTSGGARIFFSDGTSGADEYRGVVGYDHGTNHLYFSTDASERMRIDSSGQVGIGTTSPDSILHCVFDSGSTAPTSGTTPKGIGQSFGSTNGHNAGVWFSADFGGDQGISGISGSRVDQYKTDLRFYTNNTGSARAFTERMRIDSDGDVLIGKTSDDFDTAGTHIDASGQVFNLVKSGTGAGPFILNRSTNVGTFIEFRRGSSNTVGGISSNNTTTSYSTSSDYRLKENVVAISDGITRLKTLKPSRFNFKNEKDVTVDGFLAHEVTAVPEAISGTKDEVDENNNPVYQGIDQSKLVPLLVAAVQELIAKVETLETA